MAGLALAFFCAHGHAELMDRVEHRYAENDGVKIHYVTAGSGPLVVMVHGFPDFWYSWRKQIAALENTYRIAAVDLRGYNGSDKPDGVESYTMPLLVADIAAVIAAEGAESAVVAGHDWGGAIAWSLAMSRPELVSALVILNLPHPAGLRRELATNPDQQQSSAYAYAFQEPEAHRGLTAGAARRVGDGRVGPGALRGGVRSVGLRSDAELLQGELSVRFAEPTDAVDVSERALSGTDVPRP